MDREFAYLIINICRMFLADDLEEFEKRKATADELLEQIYLFVYGELSFERQKALQRIGSEIK